MNDLRIVPGLSISPLGQATIESALKDVLFDLALSLEEPTSLPVDVQHVVAALVLAARNHEIDSASPITADDTVLLGILLPHVKAVFALYGGNVSKEE